MARGPQGPTNQESQSFLEVPTPGEKEGATGVHPTALFPELLECWRRKAEACGHQRKAGSLRVASRYAASLSDWWVASQVQGQASE